MIRILRLHTIGIMTITFTNLYIWSKLLNRKINFKSAKTYLVYVLMGVTTLLNYLYNNQFIRIVTITIIMSVFIKILFNEKTNKAILSSVSSQLLYMVSEIIFVFILVCILKIEPTSLSSMFFGKILTNIVISIIAIILVQFKFVKKIYNFMLRITDKIKSNTLVILLLILMIAINIFFMTPYYHLDFTYIMVFNIILTFICCIIIMNSLYNKNNYIKVYDKYSTTLNSLKEYEDILDRYRVSNHENKNQLLTIRNMVPKSNKKVVNYIDMIVQNKLKDDDKVMYEAAKIPAGGLRGLIYSKILLMNNLNIKYKLDISNTIRTVDIINAIDDSTMLDICKIIGVYLDNSIEAVESLKDKFIDIEMYIENNFLVISISNNYKGIINLEKLENKGYTSKQNGHGYGLALTKEIIDNNKLLSNEKRISKNIFTQVLKIKM